MSRILDIVYGTNVLVRCPETLEREARLFHLSLSHRSFRAGLTRRVPGTLRGISTNRVEANPLRKKVLQPDREHSVVLRARVQPRAITSLGLAAIRGQTDTSKR
jgi:hypothetical protein